MQKANMQIILRHVVLGILTCASASFADDAAISSLAHIASTVVPETKATPEAYTPSSFVMIENRARTLGNKATASGTLYFAATDSDLIGKTPDQVLQRLSPPEVKRGQGVRQIEVLIETRRPIVAATTGQNPAYIGTAIVDAAAAAHVDVNSYILTNGITVIKK